MARVQIRADERQRNTRAARLARMEPARSQDRASAQGVTQVLHRRTQMDLRRPTAGGLLALQRTLGNRQVLRAVAQSTVDAVGLGVQARRSSAQVPQDRANLVIQRMKVGGDGAGAVWLATKHFNESNELWKAALDVLKQMEKAGTDYKSVEEIIQAVEADPKVTQERAAAKAQRAVLYDYKSDGKLTEHHINTGTWQRIPDREKPDYELITTLGAHTYSFHVHPPQFAGRRPIPGQVMRDRRMTNTATPDLVIDFIVKAKGLPAEW